MKQPVGAKVTELFQAHSAALLLYARQWLDAAGAEDVVQDVFARLLAGDRMPAEPRTWLFRCVRNAAISAWRSSRRRSHREKISAPASWFVHSPEDRLDATLAQEAMRRLPPAQREIVTLRIWSGLTLAEIRDITGLPVSSIHEQYRDALKQIRETLERLCRNSHH
ncbi:MAG TPA: RNA polymerase sigma factor [Tepidisphaeraceae bacterium]|jgi:RNA polymerase sigma-70 factor (ECF subfamily)|nr:RNA polymerase sigma factor [Tepidisphaeraceae bacterium]